MGYSLVFVYLTGGDERVLERFSLAIIHVTVETLTFLNHPVVTTLGYIAETNFSVTTAEMPDITVCNLKPFSSRHPLILENRNILNISQYASMVQGCEDCPHMVLGMASKDLFLTASAYYQNIGRKNATFVGHGIDDLFVSCYVELYDGFASEYIPCKQLVKVSLNSYPSLFNCYTLSIQSKNYSGFIAGYKLILHLDNYKGDDHYYIRSRYVHSQSVGAVVFPHIQGAKAWMEKADVFLHPGTAVDLKLSANVIQHLGPPYGSCIKRGLLKYNEDFVYTQLSCLSGCIQDIVIKVRIFPTNIICWNKNIESYWHYTINDLETSEAICRHRRIASLKT